MQLSLAILANSIIDTYFTHTTCLLIFANNKNPFTYLGDIPIVIFNMTGTQVTPHLVFNHYGCQGFIVNCKNPRVVLENIEANIKLSTERFNTRKYLFIPTDTDEEDVLEVFQSSALEYVADLNIIVRSKSPKEMENDTSKAEQIFEIVTHKYVDTRNYNEKIILDKWFASNYSFLFRNNLYPNKLTNQFGRSLRLGTINYVPYSIIDSLDGIDISLVMELAKKINVTIKIVLDLTAQWGDIYPNFTGNGILGNLVMDHTDIGFGSMFIWETEYRYLDISKQTIKSSISCLAGGPQLLGGWTTPFIAFTRVIWIVFAITTILLIATLYMALTWDNMRNIGSTKLKITKYLCTSVVLVEAMYLNQSIMKLPRNFSLRLVFAVILMMSLVLGVIYDSGLASNMTIPRYYGVIRNPRDMIRNDVQWGATEDAWILSIQESESPTHKKIVNLFVKENEEQLSQRNKDKRFAFAIERLQGGNFAVGDYISEDGAKIRRILDEDLYFDFMAFYLRKSSILLPHLDEIILRVAEAGLFDIWEYKAISRYSNSKIQKIIRDSVHTKIPGPTALEFSHVEGAFTILIVGLFISGFCFLVELFMYHNEM